MEKAQIPVISVAVITYNHENFIAKTLDNILNQQTEYSLEVIIGEDNSTDNTRKICKQYALKDSRIRLLEGGENIGMMKNFIKTLNACSGKYIAYCEGDDFWTDLNKLQSQIDYLEKNPAFVGVFHDVSVMENDIIIRNGYSNYTKDVYELNDFLNSNPVSTLSLVFRNVFKNNYPLWIQDCKVADWPLILCLTEKGPLKYFAQVMGCYRIHSNGSYYNTTNIDWHKKVMIPTFDAMCRNINPKTASRKLYIRKIQESIELNKLEKNKTDYIKNVFRLILNKQYTQYSFRDLFYLLRDSMSLR